jgi:hypothetical protein
MSIMKLFPSKYLKPDNIEDGETVTISDVQVEEVGQDKQEKPVLYFNEHEKGAILNVTNARAIAKAYGDDEGEWPGRKLVLVTIPSRTPQGEPTTSICMKPVVPAAFRMKPAPRTKKEAAEETAKDETPPEYEAGDPGNWGDDEAAA